MLPQQLEAFKDQVRRTLLFGRSIFVMGWRINHHTPFTRSLPERKVRFFSTGKPPNTLSDAVGLVVYPKYIPHADVRSVKSKADRTTSVYPVVVSYNVIIQTLEDCKDLLVCQRASGSSNPPTEETSKMNEDTRIIEESLLDFLTKPITGEKNDMTDGKMHDFAKKFLEIAKERSDATVGSRTLSDLRKEFAITESPPQLVSAGWVEAITSEGKSKIGWYKAGRLMLDLEARPEVRSVPESPAARAQFLIDKEPELLAEKERLGVRLKEIDDDLRMIEQAKALFGQIDKKLSQSQG